MFYTSANGQTDVIIENTPSDYIFTVWSDVPVNRLTLLKDGQKYHFDVQAEHAYDEQMHAYATVFEVNGLDARKYRVQTGVNRGVVVMAYNENPTAALVVKWNWNEKTGYKAAPWKFICPASMPGT